MKSRTPRAARLLLCLGALMVLPPVCAQIFGWGFPPDRVQSGLIDGAMVIAAVATMFVASARTDRFRLVWGFLAAAQLLFALGDINLDFIQHGLNHFPTTSDYLWLAYYPLVLIGTGIYLSDTRSIRPLVWLDGAIVVLVLIAAGFALSFGTTVASASAGDEFVQGQLVYPLLDLGFVALALVLAYAGRFRLGPSFLVASIAACLLFVVDLVYFKQLSDDSYVAGTLLDSGWVAVMLLMSLAAQLELRTPSPERLSIRGLNIISAAATIPALLLLVRGADHPGGEVTVACAAIAIALLALRLMLTAGENQRLADDNARIVSNAGEGIMRSDLEGHITYANPAACRMLGYSWQELKGRAGHALMHHSHLNGTPYPVEDCPLQGVIHGGAPIRVSDEVFWRKDGTSFAVDYTAAVIREGGNVSGSVIVFDDVTTQRSAEERLRYHADHDSLSGLLNRRRFIEEVEEQLAFTRRYGSTGAVLMLDLDSFKFINDSFGHDTGDELIRAVSRLLQDRLRSTDALGRLGGDEFAVLIRQTTSDAALELGNDLSRLIKSSTEPSVDASVGVAAFDGSEETVADDLIVRADIALYDAKQRGGTAILWQGQKSARLTWVDAIREAIAEDRFALYSQPIVDVETREVVSEELLIRLIDADGDIVPPAAFLPTAERFGLIQDIDRLVVRRAVTLARTGKSLSVNLSANSINDEEIMAMISDAVRSGVDPRRLTFEITETATMGDLSEAKRFAERLQRLGCALALDDFGTGLSSLGYLKQIPAQQLKIAIEFVRNVSTSSLDQYLVKTIVGIAKRLGQTTVAEGVEDAPTMATLRTLGVDYAQGYFIARPSSTTSEPPEEATADSQRVSGNGLEPAGDAERVARNA